MKMRTRFGGMQFTFENGLVLSCGNGNNHYCDNRDFAIKLEVSVFEFTKDCPNMEIAVLDEDDNFRVDVLEAFFCERQHDDVMGFVPVAVLPSLLKFVEEWDESSTR